MEQLQSSSSSGDNVVGDDLLEARFEEADEEASLFGSATLSSSSLEEDTASALTFAGACCDAEFSLDGNEDAVTTEDVGKQCTSSSAVQLRKLAATYD